MVTYDEKIEWLFRQFPSYQKVGKVAYKPGIETMEALDAALGHPHTRFPSIHVAGTNGKGSTSHFLAAGLAACGLKTGLYTSPHLRDFRERIKIVEGDSFRMISPERVEAFLDRWHGFFEEHRPSFFEITTAMAFDFFASEAVDIAVIETGLGGRLDSTNIITPVLSVITNIGLEHCEHLGFTLEAIAREKAGIIKPGVPVIVGEWLPETRPVFQAKADECCSPIAFAGEVEPFIELEVSELDLPGDYQIRNLRTLSAAAAALQDLSVIRPDVLPVGLRPGIDKAAFEEGVRAAARRTGLHGRWETLRPAGEKAQIICDTGHNAHGMAWVGSQINRIRGNYGKVFMVLGFSSDKDLDAIAPLLPKDVTYIYTQAASTRAYPVSELASEMASRGLPGLSAPSVKEAVELADSLAASGDLIFVGGSNFVVCELL